MKSLVFLLFFFSHSSYFSIVDVAPKFAAQSGTMQLEMDLTGLLVPFANAPIEFYLQVSPFTTHSISLWLKPLQLLFVYEPLLNPVRGTVLS